MSLYERLYSFCLNYSCSRFQGSGAVHVKDLKSFHEEARRSSEDKFRNSWGKPLSQELFIQLGQVKFRKSWGKILSQELLLQLGQVKFRNNWGKQLSQDLFIQLGQVRFRNSWCKLQSQDLFKQLVQVELSLQTVGVNNSPRTC